MRSIRQHCSLSRFALPALLFAAFTGCGGSGSNNTSSSVTPTAPTAPSTPAVTASNSFYVTDSPITGLIPNTLPPNIVQFSRTANGSVTPASVITGPVGLSFDAVTIDALGNIYAGGRLFNGSVQAGSEILEYSPGASGKATPTRTITTGLSTLITTGIFSMATDSANNLYVATDVAVGSGPTGRSYEGIAIYAAGESAPSRFIAGDATQILNPTQIGVDSANNVYVASTGTEAAGSIQVFSAMASGNAAPIRTISGAATTIYNTRGIAVDAAGNIYVSTITQAPANGPYLAGTPSIAEFAATAVGNVAPTNIISGSSANIDAVGNLRLDSAGTIYALGGPGVVKFAPGATGNMAPVAVITSASTTVGIGGPGIALQ